MSYHDIVASKLHRLVHPASLQPTDGAMRSHCAISLRRLQGGTRLNGIMSALTYFRGFIHPALVVKFKHIRAYQKNSQDYESQIYLSCCAFSRTDVSRATLFCSLASKARAKTFCLRCAALTLSNFSALDSFFSHTTTFSTAHNAVVHLVLHLGALKFVLRISRGHFRTQRGSIGGARSGLVLLIFPLEPSVVPLKNPAWF
jgi:hypothetical protein